MSTKLNSMQRLVADTYCGGEFCYIDDVECAQHVGDGLFTFLINEAGDVPDKGEFIVVLFAAQGQLAEVIHALGAQP